MSWDELVAAALVGTERRPVEPVGPPGLGVALHGEDGLLGAAAAWAVARRAGADAEPPHAAEPAGADPRPLCPPDAGARLAWLLDLGDARLVDEWLELAAARGLRPPPELVPALLDQAIADAARQLRAVAAAGPLGPWLAARSARWRFVPEPQAVWRDGDPAARRLLLARLRLADPAAGRELLAGTLAEEAPEDRAELVRALASGLSDADEPLLERALGDRRQEVRGAASELLSRLPRTRFAARMAERAAGLLALTNGELTVTLPGEPDAAARRDGVPRRGRRSDALAHILARAPLATWTERFARPPGQIVALRVADDFQPLVHDALARAALAQRDAEWARALWRHQPALLAVLPGEEREPLAAELPLDRIAAAVPAPWGAGLSRAVADRLAAADQPVLPGLAYALDPGVLPALEPLIESRGRPMARLCDVLAIRAAMLRELT